jgi:hypothetical protein
MRPASESNTNLQAMQAQGGGAAMTPALLAQHQAAIAAATAGTAGSGVRLGQQQMTYNLQMQQQMQLLMLQQAQQQQAAAAAAGRAPSPAGTQQSGSQVYQLVRGLECGWLGRAGLLALLLALRSHRTGGLGHTLTCSIFTCPRPHSYAAVLQFANLPTQRLGRPEDINFPPSA